MRECAVTIETKVEFTSSMFRPFLPEEAQVNPMVYGAELTFWLSQKLAAMGVVTSYPISEDWGWLIEYITDSEDEYSLCCSNVDDAKDQWRCYLDGRAKGWFGRDKASPESAKPLLSALRKLLDDTEGITEISWSV
jgi:hypothetical protein